jgi:hypothetical protein
MIGIGDASSDSRTVSVVPLDERFEDFPGEVPISSAPSSFTWE